MLFKILKRIYYLELLTPEAMKLLGGTESKITKDKNGENVPYLEITEVVLIYCNVPNNNYQGSCINLFLVNCAVYQIFHLKILYFQKHLIQNFGFLKYYLLIKTLTLQRQKTKSISIQLLTKVQHIKMTGYPVQPRD